MTLFSSIDWVDSALVFFIWISLVALGLWATSLLFPRIERHQNDRNRK